MSNHHIVVEDLGFNLRENEQAFWEGAVVDAIRMNELRGRGVATLPCIPELFKHGGFAGFAKRAWGSGWPLDGVVPSNTCPLAVYSLGDPYRIVHWAARLYGKPGQGVLRLTADAGRANAARAVIADPQNGGNAVDVNRLGKPDADGGWTVYGRANLYTPGEGYFGLALYGFAPGMRVAWLAASLTT